MRKKTYSVYSHYPVGAALLTSDGEIFTGCNIENIAFTATSCAERVAFTKAISEGKKNFSAIAIFAGDISQSPDVYPSPCGVCRQVMLEFCNPETFIVICAKSPQDYKCYTLKELIPNGFSPNSKRF